MNKIVITVVVLIVLVVGGFFLLSGNNTPQSSQNQPSPTNVVESSPTPEAVTQDENSIELTMDGFSPATLTIKVGQKVTWTNKSGTSGNVSSDPHPIHTNYPPLNLGTFEDGKTLSITFDKAGTYGYHNHLDPGQKGTIIVQ